MKKTRVKKSRDTVPLINMSICICSRFNSSEHTSNLCLFITVYPSITFKQWWASLRLSVVSLF
jgi:hypothetical protein